MYKDQLQGKKEEKENIEYIVLDETKENEVPKALENQGKQHVSQTLANVRRSTRLSRPLERFSPSLYNLLMTSFDEPYCNEEAMQVET